MKVIVTYEALDWQGNIVRQTKTCKHSFEPTVEALMKASIEGSFSILGFPSSTPAYSFLRNDLGLNHSIFFSLVKAEAKFKGWKLVLWDKDVKSSGKMRWEIA